MLGQLDGYKTYILSAGGIMTCAMAVMGWIDWASAEKIMVMLGFGAFATMRSGMKG